MKALIVYYSFSGNTEKAVQHIRDILGQTMDVTVHRLIAPDESTSFAGQCVRALRKQCAVIDADALPDINAYDMLVCGTPVWAFGMAPAMRTFMRGLNSVAGKKVLIVATYGSGAGSARCVREMADIARHKGAVDVRTLLIQQKNVTQAAMIAAQLTQVL